MLKKSIIEFPNNGVSQKKQSKELNLRVQAQRRELNQRCKVNLYQQLGRVYGHRMEEITWVDIAETMDLVSHTGAQ